MKPQVSPMHVFSGMLAIALLGNACGGSGAPAGGAGGPATTGGAAPAVAGGSASAGPAVLGEKLTPRVIEDRQQRMQAAVVAVPANWTYDSQITWNYGWVSNPLNATSTARNPANEEAVFGLGNFEYFDLRPSPPYRPGQNIGGLIYAPPVPPMQALANLIQAQRGREAAFTFVGSKELPDLPAALKMQPSQNQQGIGIKVSYTLSGKPVDEEFYAVGYQVSVPYDGPQGRTYQINWGLLSVHSFRGPAGTLDQRRPVFAAIVKSLRLNPAWEQRVGVVNRYLADQFNRQLQAGYDQIAAAAALSRQISANNDAMLATIDSQLAASRATGGGPDTSGAAKFDDYIRGVTTVDDPYYGTSQQTNNTSFHWTDGYGNYRNSTDATYDPNRTEVGNWTPMRAIR